MESVEKQMVPLVDIPTKNDEYFVEKPTEKTSRPRRKLVLVLVVISAVIIVILAVTLIAIYVPKHLRDAENEPVQGSIYKGPLTGELEVTASPKTRLSSTVVTKPTPTATSADFKPEETSAQPNQESTRSSILPTSSIVPWTAIADLVPNTESKWSRWSSWSDCTKTCGTGSRYRKRKCVAINERAVFAPITCAGKPDQIKPCAEWSCPDCSQNCTTGTLNAACDACTCDHHVLTGRVVTVDDTPLSEAKISLTGTPYNILAKTNISGHFTALGVCADDQELLVTKDGFVPVTQKAVVLTQEKATIIAKMEIAVPPFVTIHPESKIRLFGQNVTFCCNGQGNPSPEIEWFKENNIIDKELYSFDNTLKITAEHGFNGSYRCRVVNDFGSEFSDGVVLKIVDAHEAFCEPIPRTKHLKLPPNCVQQGTTKNVVDVGDCPSVPCLQNDSDNSNACKDKTFCCGVSMVEELNIACGSVAEFKLSKAKYCGCGVCKKAVLTIRGVVVGGKEEKPVQFAQIEYDGERKTNADFRSGSFSFEVRDGRKRLAVTFKDTFLKEFEDLTKVFHLQEGQSVITKVVLVTKQRPVVFDTSQDLSVPLGGETDDSAFADLEVPGGSLLKEDGTSYFGKANMRLNLVDPRNASDILSAPGDFSAVDEDGEEQILSSFGMMRVNFEDTSGNELTPSKPMKVFLDPQQLNISVDDNGNTTVKLWWLNEKTGRWVLAGNIWSDEKGSTRRKRSSSRRFLVTEITQAISKSQLNFDAPGGLCFVGVSAPPGSTARVMCGSSSNDNQLDGYREGTSNSDGIACVPTWRERLCYLQAESDNSRFLTPDGGNIASFSYGTNARVVSSDLEIPKKVESFKFYTSVTGSGPVYPFSKSNARCYRRSRANKYFRFQPPQGANATFILSSPRIDDSNNPLNWYPPSPSDINKQDVCFIKVLAHSAKATFLASSFRGNRQGATDSKVGDYATMAVDSNRKNEFVACLQIRCPGIVERAEERTDVHIIPITGHCHFQSVQIPQEFTEKNLDVPCVLPPSGPSNHEKWICVPNSLTSGFDIDFVYRADKSQENLAKHRCLVGRKNKEQITDTCPSTSGSSLDYRCE
ncbi:cartilage intermediate layer protein 1-like isoform X1 [Stylophora pistillata]|uniref:cartilage intermediate layer protein 1-like isoform X1 n=1 Tax=Stylophora pistillata TaxID=50429 RepID=UPI000C039517|nr:cartilage intermediate layer protein 1-like isoform X1 [Stylophora pistillata]